MENTYNDKPKFDPNKPFQEVKEKPAFNPNKKFEVVAENPKKKESSGLGALVGSVLGSGGPSTSKTKAHELGAVVGKSVSRPKSISHGIEQDKEATSTIGGIYNTIVGSVSRLAGGVGELMDWRDPLFGVAVNVLTGKPTREVASDFVDKARTSASSKENEKKLTSFNFADGVDWSDVGGVLASAPSQIFDIGLGVASGGGTFGVQAVNDAAKELEENPNAKDLTPMQKIGYVSTQAVVQTALDKLAVGKIFKGTGIAKGATKKIASEIIEEFAEKGIKATTQQIEKAAFKKIASLASKIKSVGIKAATGFGYEGGTEAAQQAGSDGIKLLTNKFKDKEIFDEQDIKQNFAKNVLNAGVAGGIFGGVAGGGAAALQNTNKAIRNEVANGADYEQIRQQIAEQVEQGNITPEEAKAADITAQQYAEIASKIPTEIDPEKKYAIIGGISQRESLSKEIEIAKEEILKVDPAFRREQLDKLDLLEAKLGQTNDYIEGLVLDKKPEYKKEGDAFIKTDGNGQQTEISKEHYDLAEAIKEDVPQDVPRETSSVEQTITPTPIEKVKVFRGVGKNVKSGENDGVLWVAEDKRVAENYSSEGQVEEMEIEKPSNPFEMPSNTIYVKGSDIGGKLRGIRDKLYKEGKLPKEKITEVSDAITDFVDKAGEETELYSAKTNKKESAKAFVKALQLLGFDGLVQKESFDSGSPFTNTKTGNESVTYGIFKPQKSSTPTPIGEEVGVGENDVPSSSNVASSVASHTSGVGNSVGKSEFQKNFQKDWDKDFSEGKRTVSYDRAVELSGSDTPIIDVARRNWDKLTIEEKSKVIQEYKDEVKEAQDENKRLSAVRKSGKETDKKLNIASGTSSQSETIKVNNKRIEALKEIIKKREGELPNQGTTPERSVATEDAQGTEPTPNNTTTNDTETNLSPSNVNAQGDGPTPITENNRGSKDNNTSSGEGNGAPPSGEGVGIHVERPATELSFRGLQNVANEFSLDDVQSRDTKTDIELRRDANVTIGKWAKEGKYAENIEKLVQQAERKGILTDEERVIMEQHLANVIDEARQLDKKSKEYDAKLLEIKRLKDAGEATRSAAGAALRIPSNSGAFPMTVEDAMVDRMRAANVEKLTDEQKKDVEDKFADFEKKQKEADNKIAALEEKNQALQAELEVARNKKITKKTVNKDFKKERQDIREKIKEKWEKASHDNTLSVVAVPYAKQLIAIAPDVTKLMKSYLEEGVTTLSDIVKNIHTDLKDSVPELQEKDVVDIIAGKYDTQETKYDLLTKLKSIKDKNSAEAIKIKAKLASGDFSKKPKPKSIFDNEEVRKKYPKEYKDTLDAIVAKENAKHELALANLKEEMANRSGWQKAKGVGYKALRTAKALKAGIDFSATLVQNALAIFANPVVGVKGTISAFKDFWSAGRFERELARMHNSEWWPLVEESGLAVLDPRSLRESEKSDIYNDTFFDDLKIKGKSVAPTKPFERHFTSLGNYIRVNLFLRKAAELMENKEAPKTFETHPEEFKSIAKVINNMTGRGTMSESIEKNNDMLSAVLWSPRLLASTFNILGIGEFSGKGFYRSLTPAQRKYAASQIGKGVATGIAVMLAISLAGGGEPDLDPNSVTFGTVKMGGYRYTVFGRFNSIIRSLAMVISRTKTTPKGEDDLLDNKGATMEKELIKLLRGKANPTLGIVWNAITGKEYSGKPITVQGELKNALLPMSIDEIVTGIKQDNVNGLLIRGIPSIFGAKVSNEKDFTPPAKKSSNTRQTRNNQRKPIKRDYR